jgi:hypothetical protein
MAEMRIKRRYITRPGIEAFPYGIRAVGLYSSINIKLEILVAKKRSLFLALADLYRFLGNWSLIATLSILTLFETKPIFISTRIEDGRGL